MKKIIIAACFIFLGCLAIMLFKKPGSSAVSQDAPMPSLIKNDTIRLNLKSSSKQYDTLITENDINQLFQTKKIIIIKKF